MWTFKKILSTSLVVSLLIMGGCKKTTTCNGVPNVSVYFTININGGLYPNLQYTGGSMEVTGGNAGIVIYRYQPDQFQAYDCTCPYDGASNTAAIVQIQSNKIMVKCPVCGSTFVLSSGAVSTGPATCSLKPYNTSYDGVSNLTITN